MGYIQVTLQRIISLTFLEKNQFNTGSRSFLILKINDIGYRMTVSNVYRANTVNTKDKIKTVAFYPMFHNPHTDYKRTGFH